jgi:hypothetical protein
MGYGYQKRDYEIIDYELFHLEGFHRPFRGSKPASLDDGKYITCVGAAQTFGCYANKPFPVLLSEHLNIPVLNFGVGGAGPSFFLQRKNFIQKINRGKLAVVQVMSGRSESNSVFQSNGGEMLTRISDNKMVCAGPAYNKLLKESNKEDILKIVKETRDNWIINTIQLLREIKIPKILFWFSVREPDYDMSLNSSLELFGNFPQLINGSMLNKVIPHADAFLKVVSSVGLPHPFYSRFTGEKTVIMERESQGGNPKNMNDYYPSQDMHNFTAKKLVPTLKSFINNYEK